MFGEYSQFIVPAYVISALTFLGLILWIGTRYRRLQRELESLEAAGVHRRSVERKGS